MFLATTALEDLWDPSKEILFLGSWCLTSRPPAFEPTQPYHLLPSPWDDRDRYYSASAYVDEWCEALLRELHPYLNRVHGTNHSDRYWRIVLGPWVILYVSVIYDRFVHLRAAFTEYPDLETIGMFDSSYRVPADFNEAASFVAHDPYNLQIFSQLLKIMNRSFVQRPCKTPFGAFPNRVVSQVARVLSLTERVIWLPFQSRAKATIHCARGSTAAMRLAPWRKPRSR